MVGGRSYDSREPRYRDSAIRSNVPGATNRIPTTPYESSPPGYQEREAYAGAPPHYSSAAPVAAAPPYESREVVHHDRNERGFSVLSTLMGWGVATFFTLLATALLGALLGTPLAQDAAQGGVSSDALSQAALASIVVLLVSMFIGYFLGGYTAGRMAGVRGGAHGLGVVGWTVLVAALAAIAGAALSQRFDLLAAYAPGVDLAALTVPALLTILITLAVMLGSAYLGGRVGDRSWDRGEKRHVSRHERRGRPL